MIFIYTILNSQYHNSSQILQKILHNTTNNINGNRKTHSVKIDFTLKAFMCPTLITGRRQNLPWLGIRLKQEAKLSLEQPTVLPKFVGVTRPRPRPLSGKLFVCLLGIPKNGGSICPQHTQMVISLQRAFPIQKSPTKFEVASAVLRSHVVCQSVCPSVTLVNCDHHQLAWDVRSFPKSLNHPKFRQNQTLHQFKVIQSHRA